RQVKADWSVFLELGRALARKSAGEGLVATAAVLPYPSGFGWISMVLVDEAHRRRGLAKRLLARCIDELKSAGMVPVLDATPAGRKVYGPLGFRDGWPIQRWRRIERPGSGGLRSSRAKEAQFQDARSRQVRPLEDGDWPGVLALDARAFGCDRAALLERLRERSRAFACVAVEGGRLAGFLLGRDGRIATQLGPIVAEDEATAVALTARAAASVPSPVIVDALERHETFAAWLAANGFGRERPYTRMALGQERLFGDPARTFAIAGPELG